MSNNRWSASQRIKSLLRHFATTSSIETRRYCPEGIKALRAKRMVRSMPATLGRWRHELTEAGIAERDRLVEAHP